MPRLLISRPRCLVLVGSSGLGKTALVRSWGRHIYWNGSSNIDTWSDTAEYLVLDDFPWRFIPNFKGFVGAQQEITITDKYRKKSTKQWGKPCVILTNDHPINSDIEAHNLTYLMARAEIVNIDLPLVDLQFVLQ